MQCIWLKPTLTTNSFNLGLENLQWVPAKQLDFSFYSAVWNKAPFSFQDLLWPLVVFFRRIKSIISKPYIPFKTLTWVLEPFSFYSLENVMILQVMEDFGMKCFKAHSGPIRGPCTYTTGIWSKSLCWHTIVPVGLWTKFYLLGYLSGLKKTSGEIPNCPTTSFECFRIFIT